MGVCEERTSVCEAEESPLLEAVAREWLEKTLCVVIYKVWKSVVVL
jgi:hypothetical protein